VLYYRVHPGPSCEQVFAIQAKESTCHLAKLMYIFDTLAVFVSGEGVYDVCAV